MEKANITDCELIVMNAVWEGEKDKTLMEILDIVHNRYQKYWKSQTVSTFLKRLIDKKFVSFYRIGRQYFYHAEIAKGACFVKEVVEYADLWNHTASDFLAAFCEGGKVDDQELERMKKILADLEK